MTERLSTNELKEKIQYFDQNFCDIRERVSAAANKSGRAAEDIILLAATKTVDVQVINHAIKSGLQYMGENRVQEFL